MAQKRGPRPDDERPTTVDTLSVTGIRPSAPEKGTKSDPVPAQRSPKVHVPRHAAPETAPADVLESRRDRFERLRAASRVWAGRPAGRMVLAGLVIALTLGGGYAAGAHIVPAVSKPQAGQSPPEQQQPTEDGNGPVVTGAAPVPELPSATAATPSTGTKERPADALAAWAGPRAVKLDIPPVAMQAYAYAEVVTARSTPRCKITWSTLAGIAKVESDHGRANGALLQDDGRSLPAIVGPPLDGQSNRQSIPDTDGGTLDTDKTWDRAVGPMQFLPTTWKQFGLDADADGVIDPNDVDDASLTAAAYLCANNRDMSTVEGWNEAIKAYNLPEEYRASVYNATNDYGKRERTA